MIHNFVLLLSIITHHIVLSKVLNNDQRKGVSFFKLNLKQLLVLVIYNKSITVQFVQNLMWGQQSWQALSLPVDTISVSASVVQNNRPFRGLQSWSMSMSNLCSLLGQMLDGASVSLGPHRADQETLNRNINHIMVIKKPTQKHIYLFSNTNFYFQIS